MAILSVDRRATLVGTVDGGEIFLSSDRTFASEDFLDIYTGAPLPEGKRFCALNVANNSQIPFLVGVQAGAIFAEVMPGQSYRYDLYPLGGSAGITFVNFIVPDLAAALGSAPRVSVTAEFLP